MLMRLRPQPKCFQQVDVLASDIQVALTMTPQAIVTGRIVDQAGKPVENLHLNLMQKENLDGHET
jgi:protocatechuate 3,4-dioxygenase beta subunit